MNMNHFLNASTQYNAPHLTDLSNEFYFSREEVESFSGFERLKQIIDHEGFAIIDYGNVRDISSILTHLEDFLGTSSKGWKPENPLIVAITPQQQNSTKRYLANTTLTQQLHTDEAQLPKTRRYMSLFCHTQVDEGGVSTLAQFSKIIPYIRDEITCYEKLLCSSGALEVFGANGFVKRPLILKLGRDDYGIIFPTMLKGLRASEQVMKTYLKILKLVHLTKNQIRLKLKPGQLLLLDNYKVLHGRTSFAENQERLLYRTGYEDEHFLRKNLILSIDDATKQPSAC